MGEVSQRLTVHTRHFEGSINPTRVHLVTPKTTIAKQTAGSEMALPFSLECPHLVAGSFAVGVVMAAMILTY